MARLGQAGAFPNANRPRVLWVALDEPTGALAALQQRVDDATQYLVEPDGRGFSPHLTLGRTRSGRGVRELAAMLQGYQLGTSAEAPIRDVLLFRSVLGRHGPTYTVLHRSPVGG
jgi:2'-5' RNA ligase